jgi:hypothetical protein
MYTATVLLEIEKFVPMTGIYGESPSIIAKVHEPKDITPGPKTDVFSGDGNSITITVPKDYEGSVQLIYQLPDSKYVLLGAAFKGPNGGVGREEFRDIELHRDPYGSEMTVTDACMDEANDVTFSYVILVQEVSTANIGLIDPDIETQQGED